MRRETAGVEVESAYYWYNAANELTDRVAYPGPISTYYFYDSNGALLREWAGGSTTYYAYGENRLIRSITPPSGSPWRFWYDARLSRYCIDKGGTFAYYNWDGLRNLEERSASGALVARFTHGRSRLPGIGTVVEVERNAGGGTYYQYPLMDHRGTAYVIADAAENAQIQYVLDSFGRELAAPSGLNPSVPNELIGQTNWLSIKVGDRWYGLSKYRINMPELGIFLSRDFLNYPNKYRAWSNNPVGQVDNNGLQETEPQPTPAPAAEEEATIRVNQQTGASTGLPAANAPNAYTLRGPDGSQLRVATNTQGEGGANQQGGDTPATRAENGAPARLAFYARCDADEYVHVQFIHTQRTYNFSETDIQNHEVVFRSFTRGRGLGLDSPRSERDPRYQPEGDNLANQTVDRIVQTEMERRGEQGDEGRQRVRAALNRSIPGFENAQPGEVFVLDSPGHNTAEGRAMVLGRGRSFVVTEGETCIFARRGETWMLVGAFRWESAQFGAEPNQEVLHGFTGAPRFRLTSNANELVPPSEPFRNSLNNTIYRTALSTPYTER